MGMINFYLYVEAKKAISQILEQNQMSWFLVHNKIHDLP